MPYDDTYHKNIDQRTSDEIVESIKEKKQNPYQKWLKDLKEGDKVVIGRYYGVVLGIPNNDNIVVEIGGIVYHFDRNIGRQIGARKGTFKEMTLGIYTKEMAADDQYNIDKKNLSDEKQELSNKILEFITNKKKSCGGSWDTVRYYELSRLQWLEKEFKKIAEKMEKNRISIE